MNKIRRQSGVLVFLTPFLMVALAVVAVLAMDAARLYSVKADMQRVVNAAATAAADEAQACGAGDLTAMTNRALAAAKAMGYEEGVGSLEVQAGVLLPRESKPGELKFIQTPDIEQSNAAAVRYTRKEPVSRLLPESFLSPLDLSVNAASRKDLYAVLSAGASTVSVDGGLLSSLIGAVLGQPGPYSLDATDISSLQGTLVSVGDLVAGLGVADLTAFAGEPLIDLLEVIAGLGNEIVTQPVADIVRDLKGVAGINELTVEDALEIHGDKAGAMDASFPLYDFVISVVMNSASKLNDGGALVGLSLDTFETDSPLISAVKTASSILADINLELDLHVDNPAPVVIGPALKDSDGWVTNLQASDISLAVLAELGLNLDGLEALINVLSLGTIALEIADDIRVPVVVEVGGGSVEFVGARCARPEAGNVGVNHVDLEVQLENTALSIASGTLDSATGSLVPEPVSAKILEIDALFSDPVGLCLAANLSATIPSVAGTQNHYVMDYPLYCPDGVCETSEFTGDADSSLDGIELGLSDVTLLGCAAEESDDLDSVIGKLLSPVTKLVEDVTALLLEGLIAPLLKLLGVDVGSVNVTVTGADQLGHQLIENVDM
ncbi:hypothetical protein [Marinobacter sp. UBA3607]|uniref:hypothetical protein n=1 Tax=Marinobacter sp. UBA3607 TaxID=1946820 RepID=UPI0025810F09|nr:hypothetical protein [Marinobacter sp. UBA3607]